MSSRRRSDAREAVDEAELQRLVVVAQQDLDALQAGHLDAIDRLVEFLELDVYAFRSGYLKADVIRHLIRVDLSKPTMARLRGVVLWVVDAWDRSEFGAYIRLARRVWDPGLQVALERRVATFGPDHGPGR